MDKKANNHQTSSKNGITIISVAALSFAVVSWKATAEGLDAYVFENGWQSMLISFAIQSILFVFNLRLPFYYKHIGEMQKVREKKKYRFGPKKGTEKNTYKSTVFQKVILAFYIVTLLSSSFFSYIYICDYVVYEHQSGYVDDNAILLSEYREILKCTDDYIKEDKKAMQILASKILGEIQHEYPEGERTDSTITFQELENNLQEAETLLNDAIDSYNDAKKDADNLYDVVEGYKEQRLSTGWHDQQAKWEMEYKEAKTKWDEAVNVRKEKEEERDKAKKAFTEADKAVKNYKKPQESIIAEFLSEMLKENSLIDNLESSISELNDAIVLQGENVNIVDNYSDLVEKTQVLTIVVEDYIALSKAISEEKGVTFLSQELMKEIIIPNPKSATFESEYITWKATWSEKINNLESLIHNLPEFSENELAELEKGETVVDTKMLNSYKANKMLNRLDELRRSKISDINVIEKATSLLFSKYFFTAWFSLALALVLDLSSLLAGLFIFSIQKKRAS